MAEPGLIVLSERRPKRSLEALNRITGVRWQGLPRSLLPQVRVAQGQKPGMSGERQRRQAG